MTTTRPRILATTSTFPLHDEDPTPRFIYEISRGISDDFDLTVVAPAVDGDRGVRMGEHFRIIRFAYAPSPKLEILQTVGGGGLLARMRSRPWRIAMLPTFLFAQARMIRRLLATENFDCIHAHWLVPQGLIASYSRRPEFGPPVIITCHGGDVPLMSQWPLRSMARIIADRADLVTTVSARLERILRCNIGISPERDIPVIPYGVDTERFNPDLAEPTPLYATDKMRPLILSVGRLVPVKGIGDLLRAMSIAPLRDTAAHLLIVGEGPLRKRLEMKVTKLGLTGRVTFLGTMSHAELARVYASVDLFCLPSYSEGEPNVVWEAAASGLPIVSTFVEFDREDEGSGSFLQKVAPGQVRDLSHACARLILDHEARQRMGAAAREAALCRSWKLQCQKYIAILHRTIEKGSRQN